LVATRLFNRHWSPLQPAAADMALSARLSPDRSLVGEVVRRLHGGSAVRHLPFSAIDFFRIGYRCQPELGRGLHNFR
jgi:hypothetical protein